MALFRGHKPLISKCPTPPCGFIYDVFLSFRGEDTRKNFTDHLYTALVNAGIRTFRDNIQLDRGENIKEELEKAIQQSRGSVIVFSKHYTSSKWCLEELVMILERRRTSNHVVLPVFYDVCPSEVRQLAESLAKVPRYREDQSSEKLNGWRAALLEVADLGGMVLQNEADGHEAEFIQKIVGVIQRKLHSPVPLSHVQKELEDKLSFVGPVLYDAEGKQLKFQTSVKPWLHKLKEAVYEAEDLLQEIKTEVLRQKMEPESGSSTSKVQEIIDSPPFNAFGSALIHRKVDEVLNRLDNIMEKRRDVLGMEASAGYSVSKTLPSTSLVEECVYGRDEQKETLIKLLLSDDGSGNKISMISIVGMGGIGKTTLAQFMYNDVAVKQHFDVKGWACVSKEFDVLTISQHLYESLTSKACQIMNLALLQSKLQETLMGKRFLFVLDDIWNKNYTEWDVLTRPFLFGEHGSKIIITTRNQDVASMVCTREAHRLMPMSEEDGWLLFEKHAFKNAGVGAHSHLEAIGRKIVRKCKGLPLAIKSLGGLLCSKLIVGEWETILNSDIWDLPQEESDILPSLWLSYKDLPPHLRRCFAYCSIFPKNYKFFTSELVYLWMGEDLLQPRKDKTAQEIGQEYFNDLVSRSFFQFSIAFHKYSMHDLINDLASFASGEFCLRWKRSHSPNVLSKTRQFSYHDYHVDGDPDNRRKMFEALQEAKCLRTFLPLRTIQSPKLLRKVPYEVLSKLQSLRVLKLSGQTIEELPDSINNLKHLRYLALSSTAIRKLPDTICTLYNLQVLLLSFCSCLTELPADLGRLINLSHLDISHTKLQKMPPCMGNLKDLQMLGEYVLDKETAEDNLPELKKLQNLRGRLHISGLVHSSCLEAYILRDKKFLKELILVWGGLRREETGVLEKLQPHLNLEELTIIGYGGQVFPGWSAYYFSSALVYLKLDDCENIVTLPPLGQLPSLADLHIEGLHRVVSIGSEFYYGVGNTTSCCVKKPFRSLRSIHLQRMRGLKEWCYVGGDDNEGGVFPRLVELFIFGCPRLTGRLALDSFPMLKVVSLAGTDISLVSMSPDSELLSLNKLRLVSYANIATFFDRGLHALKLKPVRISKCEKLSSWPGQLPSLFPPLVSLLVLNCRELEPFPEGGFPSKLEPLEIWGSKKVNAKTMQNLKNGLRRLASLKSLSFDSDEKANWLAAGDEGLVHSTLIRLEIRLSSETIDGAKWFGHLSSLQTLRIMHCHALRCLPESGLPSSLKTLDIWNCAALQCLSECGIPTSLKLLSINGCPGFLCLPENELPTSVKTLRITNCPALECFPDCRLPTSLVHLFIEDRPLLHKGCLIGTGEDWPKIAHILHIYSINDDKWWRV